MFSNQNTLSPKGGARIIWSYNWTYVISEGNINFNWLYSNNLVIASINRFSRNLGTAVNRRPSFIKRLVFPHFTHQPFYASLMCPFSLKVAKDCIKIKLTDGELKGIWYYHEWKWRNIHRILSERMYQVIWRELRRQESSSSHRPHFENNSILPTSSLTDRRPLTSC